jgi:hypothetical protein
MVVFPLEAFLDKQDWVTDRERNGFCTGFVVVAVDDGFIVVALVLDVEDDFVG